jgi:cell division protein FtsI/penicillin-binding protein 2
MIDGRGLSGPKAYDLWRNAVTQFGIGHKLGIDLPGENRVYYRHQIFIPNAMVTINGVQVSISPYLLDKGKWV